MFDHMLLLVLFIIWSNSHVLSVFSQSIPCVNWFVILFTSIPCVRALVVKWYSCKTFPEAFFHLPWIWNYVFSYPICGFLSFRPTNPLSFLLSSDYKLKRFRPQCTWFPSYVIRAVIWSSSFPFWLCIENQPPSNLKFNHKNEPPSLRCVRSGAWCSPSVDLGANIFWCICRETKCLNS